MNEQLLQQKIEAVLAPVMQEVQLLRSDNHELKEEIMRLSAMISSQSHRPSEVALISSKQCAELLNKNRSTISRYKRQYWIQGVHYFPQGSYRGAEVFYDAEAIQHWQAHRMDPEKHQQYCEQKIRKGQAA